MKQINYYSFIIGLVVLSSLTYTAKAQYAGDLKINEVMIQNDSNYVDEYGRCVSWIEIFNTAYNSVNVGGCYLSNDRSNLKMYPIPKTDPKTLMEQRSHVVFYADNEPKYGTFHINFDLSDCDTIYLVNADGKGIIDAFALPKGALRNQSNVSYGRLLDGCRDEKVEIDGQEVQNPTWLKHFTPGSTNETEDKQSKSDGIKITDPYGIGLTIIAMTVVFSALILIFIMLKGFGLLDRYMKKKNAQKEAVKKGEATPENIETVEAKDYTGAELAAITMALHLYTTQMHDEESEIITFEDFARPYSPWSQKHLLFKNRNNQRK